MNFTGEIKRELCRELPEKRCCLCALLAAAADTGGDLTLGEEGGFSFTSESERSAEFLLGAAESLGVRMNVAEAVRDPKHGKDKLTFSCYGRREGRLAEEIASRSPAGKIGDCCRRSYLRGAFLCGGSCTLPREGKKTGYHLEVLFRGREEAEAFRSLLEEEQVLSAVLMRGEKAVVYIKSREAIADFLAVAGADAPLQRLESVAGEREENNNRNRVENCTAGNADRAAIASAAQVVAIAELKERGAFSALPAPLRETAEARIAHPALSLSELASLLNITKSCLNHRMRKLLSLCAER